MLGLLGDFALAAGGGTVAVYAFVKTVGEKWIDKAIRDREALARHDREKELTELKGRINQQFDRFTKLSQREFEVLPDIWYKIVDASAELEFVSMSLKSRVYLTKLPDEECLAHLANLNLGQSDIDHVMQATGDERNNRYWRICDILEARTARNNVSEAHFALEKNGIFLPEEVSAALGDLKELLWAASNDCVIRAEDKEMSRMADFADLARFRAEGRQKVAAVKVLVRDRLQGSGDAPA